MIKLVIDAALLRRDPYLRMVVAPNGVGDGAIIVALVGAILMIPALVDGLDVFAAARAILRSLVWWIILSGLVYLIGRHGFEGYGSFPGTMAAVSIGFPVLISGLLLAPFVSGLTATLIVSVWLVATLWVAARVALELDSGKAAIAAAGGWAGFVVVAAIFGL
jgi:hypothetical protein